MKFLVRWKLLLCILGSSLTAVNVYGLFQDIRPAHFSPEDLRFEGDIAVAYEKTLSVLARNVDESEKDYTSRLSHVISEGISHIHWVSFDNTKFNQLIPIWENYFLYFMGKVSSIPEFERYHFADYKRSLKRGIGICGDASMIMSQLLEIEGIQHDIINFPSHIVVGVNFSDGTEFVQDPDFGITIPHSPGDIQNNVNIINDFYANAGYTESDLAKLHKIYNNKYKRWDDVEHFITKKYYFEYLTYALKWPLPIFMMLLALFLFIRKNKILKL
jgi:hypothetical protein